MCFLPSGVGSDVLSRTAPEEDGYMELQRVCVTDVGLSPSVRAWGSRFRSDHRKAAFRRLTSYPGYPTLLRA